VIGLRKPRRQRPFLNKPSFSFDADLDRVKIESRHWFYRQRPSWTGRRPRWHNCPRCLTSAPLLGHASTVLTARYVELSDRMMRGATDKGPSCSRRPMTNRGHEPSPSHLLGVDLASNSRRACRAWVVPDESVDDGHADPDCGFTRPSSGTTYTQPIADPAATMCLCHYFGRSHNAATVSIKPGTKRRP
jgi:hypothetical protein